MAAEGIMVQGTMSGVGKSILTAALCRIFLQDGLRVAPFKSQNMALNSYVTPDGLEIGRAQAMQAEAAGVECDVRMNPILLKPTGETGSQVIVNGEVKGQYSAGEYFRMKRSLIPGILEAYHSLAEENDVIVIEGAGSPAEINLRQDDIVNMGLAELVNAPVLLVGDIDRGGVFAQLYGTAALLAPTERERLAGLVINKFRGDPALLEPGLRQIENLVSVPVLGVIPYMKLDIDEEDSLAPALERRNGGGRIDVAVLRLPHISNFTDFTPLEEHPDITVRYVGKPDELGLPDLLILPGTKNTMTDLAWLWESGFAGAVSALAESGMPILGICGGYQMLGERISDPNGVECRGEVAGLGLLPCTTRLTGRKTRCRTEATGAVHPFAGIHFQGYEIHMGETENRSQHPFARKIGGVHEGAASGNVFGTYLHGLFDSTEAVNALAAFLADRKGIPLSGTITMSRRVYREQQYNRLADVVRQNLDLSRIYKVMEAYHA